MSNNFKPKRGVSFFLRSATRNTYAFGIVLSSRSDEDDEYKILRTDFADSPALALKLPLAHTDMFDFEDSEFYSVQEWDKGIIKSLSRRQLFGKQLEVQMLQYEKPEESASSESQSELDEIVSDL